MARTLLDATYRSDMCGKAVCTPAQTIPAGNHLPGIARNMGYASLAFAPPEGWHAGAELRYMSDIQANDANSAQAPAYTVAGVNAGYRFTRTAGRWTCSAG